MKKGDKVACIGSGLVGSSWATIFASAGYEVWVYDSLEGQALRAKERIKEQLSSLEAEGALRGALSAQAQCDLIHVADSVEQAVTGATYIQESVPENVEMKKAAFAEVDKSAAEDAILATSSTALNPDLYTEGISRRNRVVLSHPTNPPYFCPLVEVMAGSWADKDVLPTTVTFLKEIGQSPVVINKFKDGFVLNRLQYAILNEAWSLAKEGVMSTEDIDKVLKDGLARRWTFIGPFETIHLNAEGARSYIERYASGMERVSATLYPTPRYTDPAAAGVAAIAAQVEQRMPLDMLEDFKTWRDNRLVQLDKFIKELNVRDPFPVKK